MGACRVRSPPASVHILVKGISPHYPTHNLLAHMYERNFLTSRVKTRLIAIARSNFLLPLPCPGSFGCIGVSVNSRGTSSFQVRGIGGMPPVAISPLPPGGHTDRATWDIAGRC